MKRNLLLFGLLLTIVSNIVAQEPIAMEGKEWTYRTQIPYKHDGLVTSVIEH